MRGRATGTRPLPVTSAPLPEPGSPWPRTCPHLPEPARASARSARACKGLSFVEDTPATRAPLCCAPLPARLAGSGHLQAIVALHTPVNCSLPVYWRRVCCARFLLLLLLLKLRQVSADFALRRISSRVLFSFSSSASSIWSSSHPPRPAPPAPLLLLLLLLAAGICVWSFGTAPSSDRCGRSFGGRGRKHRNCRHGSSEWRSRCARVEWEWGSQRPLEDQDREHG